MMAMPWPNVTLTKIDASGVIQTAMDKHYDPLPGFLTWGYDVVEGSDGSFYVVGNYSCDGVTNDGLFVMKVSDTGDSCTAVTSNTTPEGTASATVSSFPPPAETSSPNTTLAGEFNASDSSAVPTPICELESLNGKIGSMHFPDVNVCGGPTIEFDIEDTSCGTNQACLDERKVLISTVDSIYPSPYQSQDKIIKIWVTVRDSLNQLQGGETVYFRLTDPVDPSVYVIPPNPYTPDNKGGPGLLSDTVAVTESNPMSPDFGKAWIELEITDRYAGDNYQIEASFQPFPGGTVVSESGVITAWKRIYVEKDKMFRKGGLLKASAQYDDTQVIVYKWTPTHLPNCPSTKGTSPCYRIAIFDSLNPYEGIHEEPYVGWVTQDAASDWVLHLVNPDMTDYHLTRVYFASAFPSFTQGNPAVPSCCSAAVGVLGLGFYEADLGTLTPQLFGTYQALGDAYIDVVTALGAGAIPYLPKSWFDAPSGTIRRAGFSAVWFSNYLADNSLPPPPGFPPANKARNQFHLMGATNATAYDAITNSTYDSSYIMVKNILDRSGSPSDKTNNIRSTTAHELAHQFSVNPSSCTNHDARPSWCGGEIDNSCGTEQCLMDPNRNRTNTVDRLCSQDIIKGEPSSGSVVCSGQTFIWNAGDGALRTRIDPQ